MSKDESHYFNLRRADWRFLLSNPRPGKSICFMRSNLIDAVELMSELTINPESIEMSNECDLAVAVNPDKKTLLEAYSVLKPSGAIYIEWDGNILTNVRHIQHQLNTIGFHNVVCYRPIPEPSKTPTCIWVPLKDKESVQYLFADKYRIEKGGYLRYFGKYIRCNLLTWCPKLFLKYPWFISPKLSKFTLSTIAYKPILNNINQSTENARVLNTTLPARNGFIGNISKVIEACLTSLRLEKKSQEISILMSSVGESLESAILFLFAINEIEPIAVIKSSRTSDANHLLENEANILDILNKNRKKIERIPKILYAGCCSGIYIVGESFLDGHNISKIVNKSNHRELALKVTSWLIDLAINTKAPLPYNWKENYVFRVISDWESSADLLFTSELFQQTRELLVPLELPCLVCEHRDFAPQNVNINSRGELGIFDWSEARLSGFPALDLIFFLTYLNFHATGKWFAINFKECYREMLNNSTPTGEIFNECLEYYTRMLGIPTAMLGSLRLLTWLLRSQLWHQKDLQQEDTKILRESLFINLWKEELLHHTHVIN